MTQRIRTPALVFKPVDLDAHFDICKRFKIETHIVAFGSTERFFKSDGTGVERYAIWLKQKETELPGCLVHVWQGDQIIGQIELGRVASDPLIGYVNLFYLIPEVQGLGLGALLEAYAWTFLCGLGCRALRLSASPTNLQAWNFYLRGGWVDLGVREDNPDVHLLHKVGSENSQGSPLVIDPDSSRETDCGRTLTLDCNQQSWELAYEQLRYELEKRKKGIHLYVVTGMPGAGKSDWISENLGRLGPRAIVVEAPFTTRRDRARVLSIARTYGVPAIGIFVHASLDLVMARNARRSVGARLPQVALDSMFRMIESPVRDEGFVWTQVVE